MDRRDLFIRRSTLADADVPVAEQDAEYLRKIAHVLDTEFLSIPQRFAFSTFFLGAVSIFELVASPRRSERRREQIAIDGYDAVFAQLIVDGAAKGSSRRSRWDSLPGTIMMLDLTQPFVVTDVEPRHVINVAFPRHLIAAHVPDVGRLHGLVIPVERAAMFTAHLREITRRIDHLPLAAAQAFGKILLELLLVALDLAPATEQVTRQQRVRERANAMIDARLSSRALTPGWLATAVGVSRSELYRCFEGDGGVERAIWSRRLALARRMLEDPGNAQRIGEIATTVGFSGAAHFARMFKTAFGVSPGAFRKGVDVPE